MSKWNWLNSTILPLIQKAMDTQIMCFLNSWIFQQYLQVFRYELVMDAPILKLGYHRMSLF